MGYDAAVNDAIIIGGEIGIGVGGRESTLPFMGGSYPAQELDAGIAVGGKPLMIANDNGTERPEACFVNQRRLIAL